MKKYIDSIADIMNSTSQALLIFSLALTLLGGGGLAIFGIVTFVSQLRDHKSLTSITNGSYLGNCYTLYCHFI